jgi:UDP-galactopyranose mutase
MRFSPGARRVPRGKILRADVLVVGAGFAGAVAAAQMAEAGSSVLVIDVRNHIGGNAYDCKDPDGVLIHPYGPHIFHTGSPRIADYLSRFTSWRKYEHRVLAQVDDKLVPFPINRTTINKLYGLALDEAGVEEFLRQKSEVREALRTSEDVVLSRVGRDLCDMFFRGYTLKQWNRDLSELSASVAFRIPLRFNDDDRYFTDSFQHMPADGYTVMFENMLAHPNIRVELNTDYQDIRERVRARMTIYTGPLDSYFKYCYGKLPYRSLRFEHRHLQSVTQLQPVGTINYPNDHAYTRTTEFKHLTGQQHCGTSFVREYPTDEGDPYYPVLNQSSMALYGRYFDLARTEKNTMFVGRLAQFKYLNMDQVVDSALKATQQLVAQGWRGMRADFRGERWSA